MKVRELIEHLKQEDPESIVTVVLSNYANCPLPQLQERERGYFDEIRIDGKDHYGSTSALVLIAGRDQ